MQEHKSPVFWGLHAVPGKIPRIALGALPFIIVIAAYLTASHYRHVENPDDKILPTPVQMVDAVQRMAFTEDKRTGTYLFWVDTWASLQRILIALGSAAFCGLLLGMNLGIFRGFRALFAPIVTFVSIIPPLSILPILFITFGVDEFAKMMLIFLGTFPMITRDIYMAVRKTSVEHITKAQTLGSDAVELVYKVIMPQIMPRLIETVRLALGAAWLFLIAAEAIASTSGLGYRIFLVRRYLAMDIIIPYAIWITLLGYMIDLSLRQLVARKYPWYGHAK